MKNKPTKKRRALTFRDLVEPALEAKRLRRQEASSIRADRMRLRRVLPRIGRLPLRELTSATFERLLEDLARGDDTHKELSGATVNRYHSLISSICRYAVRQGIMRANPMDSGKVPMAKERKVHVRFLGRDEERRLVQVIRADCPEKELELQLAICTGMRRGEQFSAKWEDLKVDAGILYVTGKSGARPVHLGEAARTCLEELRKRAPADQIYITPEANTGKADRRTWFERAVRKAGLRPKFRYHDLRHTFCSRLAEAGVSLIEIQEFAGHAAASTTVRYAHLSAEHRKQAIEKVRMYTNPPAASAEAM